MKLGCWVVLAYFKILCAVALVILYAVLMGRVEIERN
jgi:hypothetical protein